MDEEIMAAFKEDFGLLIESGFVAVKQLDEISATRIFDAAAAINPTHMAPQIGKGFIALNKLEIKTSTRIFESILEKEPENYFVQALLGMCYLLTKGRQKKGEKIIKNAMEKTTDPTVKNLGANALEWLETDLSKKNKLPFFANQPESPEKE